MVSRDVGTQVPSWPHLWLVDLMMTLDWIVCYWQLCWPSRWGRLTWPRRDGCHGPDGSNRFAPVGWLTGAKWSSWLARTEGRLGGAEPDWYGPAVCKTTNGEIFKPNQWKIRAVRTGHSAEKGNEGRVERRMAVAAATGVAADGGGGDGTNGGSRQWRGRRTVTRYERWRFNSLTNPWFYLRGETYSLYINKSNGQHD